MAYIYDLEVYPNLFMGIFINLDPKYNAYINEYIACDIKGDLKGKIEALRHVDYKVFTVSENINESMALANWMVKKQLVGYNNHNYDDKILRFLVYYKEHLVDYSNSMLTLAIHNLSTTIITSSDYYNQSEVFEAVSKWGVFYSVDLMKTHYLDKKKISLKNVAIKLNWYRIQDLPIKPHEDIPEDKIQDIKDYCINDVLITRALWYAKIGDIKLRNSIKQEYKIDVLSSSRSSIADKILYKLYSEKAGYTDKKVYTNRTHIIFDNLIDPNIEFKSEHLKAFLIKLKSTVHNRYEKFEEGITINETNYQLGVGGLHSVDIAGEFKFEEGYVLRDCDVTSYYPQIIINRKACPAHLNPDILIPIVANLMAERIVSKVASRDKSLQEDERLRHDLKQYVFKIIINSLFGKLGTDGLWTCDHAAMYKVTLNGQLYLLELAERYEEVGIKVVSANTDGLLCKVPVDLMGEYEKISNEWCAKHRFNLEFDNYKLYVRRNVNSYMAITYDNKIKLKNDFVYDLENDPDHLIKGFRAKIIAYGLHEYYVNNTPVRDTVMACKNIYDFCKSQKVGDQFKTMLYYVDKETGLVCRKELQKTNRYFVSKNGGAILKEDGKGKKINVLKGTNITLLNDFFEVDDFSKYNVNYSYYIKQVNDIIYEIQGLTKKTIGRTGLTLFD